MEEITYQATDTAFKKYVPFATAICCAICIALFTGINLEDNIDTWDVYRKWGAPSVTDIFEGDYWGLITSNFLHIEIWHLAFNLYWLWIFGKKIEFETNKAFYCFFPLSSALVSSLAQLAFSDTTGIGLSGIGYALFGYLFIKSRTAAAYKNHLEKKTITLFLFWLVLCVILTKTGVWAVSNAAHIGGLLWGGIIAYISKYDKYLQWSVGFIYIAIITILIKHSPFATAYLSYQAYELHKNQKIDEAVKVYHEILERDPDSQFAKENLAQIKLYQSEEMKHQ